MINRRLIRIKVLQVLYAYSKKNDGISSLSAEKELFHSIDKFYDLYLMLFLIAVEMAKIEEQKIEIRKNKKIKTQEDLHPDSLFTQNIIISKIKNNKGLSDSVNDRKLNIKLFEEVFRNIYNQFVENELYINHLKHEGQNFESDRNFLNKFFTEFLVENQFFLEFLEEENIYWNDDLNFALIMVVKNLENLKSENSKFQFFPLFKNDDDKDFAKKLLRNTIVKKTDYVGIIEKHTQNWDTDRIAQIDLLILQMAITELLEFNTIPVKVTLNEFIEISKYYSTDKSKIFINGVLDNIIKQMQSGGQIKKTGRGLVN